LSKIEAQIKEIDIEAQRLDEEGKQLEKERAKNQVPLCCFMLLEIAFQGGCVASKGERVSIFL
jgi:hypothetical protein